MSLVTSPCCFKCCTACRRPGGQPLYNGQNLCPNLSFSFFYCMPSVTIVSVEISISEIQIVESKQSLIECHLAKCCTIIVPPTHTHTQHCLTHTHTHTHTNTHIHTHTQHCLCRLLPSYSSTVNSCNEHRCVRSMYFIRIIRSHTVYYNYTNAAILSCLTYGIHFTNVCIKT